MIKKTQNAHENLEVAGGFRFESTVTLITVGGNCLGGIAILTSRMIPI